MANVLFFEKPGCINNGKQKKLLIQSGHRVDSRNLLEHKWERDELMAYFDGLPVSEWFNRTAPSIKDGWIDPDALDEDRAITLMLAEPILIRRPLMCVDDELMVGFDPIAVDEWIGLALNDKVENLESCPRNE